VRDIAIGGSVGKEREKDQVMREKAGTAGIEKGKWSIGQGDRRISLEGRGKRISR